MPRKTSLGLLVIVFGPDVRDDQQVLQHVGRLRSEPLQLVSRFPDFHWQPRPYEPEIDPFRSLFFGPAVKDLLEDHLVVLGDATFDKKQRRDRVARAFRRTFPDLSLQQVQVGGELSFFGSEDGIIIDDDVYEQGSGGSNETIVVESDASESTLGSALHAASTRMAQVGENGHEYSGMDVTSIRGGYRLHDDALASQVYTPNYVSNLTIDENGNLGFYVDCKSVIASPMAAQFRQILVEEFRKAGIISAHVRVPSE